MNRETAFTRSQRDCSVGTSVPGFESIQHRSPVMRRVIEQTRRVALAGCPVLITGESGAGKELIAEAIHRNSQRSAGPYQIVNMAAIPVTLVESELFGHRRGAFTGATETTTGQFERANGGTLFIDEIGDFEISSQAKLLRVLESHRFTPVGDTAMKTADVRVVAATSRNLDEMMDSGAFRKDLYYRLNVVAIELPPLRERREDIVLLADYFLRVLCAEQQLELLQMSDSLLEFMESFPWPGNIRQLRNCIESMVVMARESMLSLQDLPQSILQGRDKPSFEEGWITVALDDVERDAIERTLKFHRGNRTHAARSLGISVRTLRRRLNES